MQLADNRITEQQLELLKSFRYLTNENEIKEVKELLSLYYEHKLDTAINKAETDSNSTAQLLLKMEYLQCQKQNMNTTTIVSKIASLPEEKQQEVSDFIDFLFEKENKKAQRPLKKRTAGAFEGQIKILPHFDDPIEGMEEYYQ